jgi:hypothetical protein
MRLGGNPDRVPKDDWLSRMPFFGKGDSDFQDRLPVSIGYDSNEEIHL